MCSWSRTPSGHVAGQLPPHGRVHCVAGRTQPIREPADGPGEAERVVKDDDHAATLGVAPPVRIASQPVNVTSETARRFLAARHLLAPARALEGGPEAVLEVVRRFGSIQFDPLAVAGRNHDLVLHARVAGYDPAWCDLLYERSEAFEAFNKGLALVPTSELPWFRARRSQTATRILADNAGVAERVLERIRAEGSLSVLDFERGPGGDHWGWGDFGATSVVRAVLEAYSVTGVLGLARRDGNRRYYDLIERLLPADVLVREIPLREQLRHKLLSRFRAHGLLGVAGSGDVFGGLGPAKLDPRWPDSPGRTALREELVEDGELVRVTVEGVRGPRFVLRDELDLLAAPPEPPASVAFLPPLDPLMWDRSLLKPLFDFEWVWEVYVPEGKRRWGYYVLPILFRDRFVGRIEPRIDRGGGAVRVLGLWWEEQFDPRRADGFVDAMRDALRAYLSFAGASHLEWTPHVGAHKRLFGGLP
jgi:uncharacterized protein YcaQ